MDLAGAFFGLDKDDVRHIEDLEARPDVHHDLSDLISRFCLFLLQILMDTRQRPFHALVVERFQEIVDRANLKRFHRILLERGRKDDQRVGLLPLNHGGKRRPVHPAKVDIYKTYIEALAVQHLKEVFAVICLRDLRVGFTLADQIL